jgi:hypothetical protein
MHDTLTAFHFVRYLELQEKERQPYREVMPEAGPSLAIRLFRRLHAMRSK